LYSPPAVMFMCEMCIKVESTLRLSLPAR
jgi:hypothetical protein